MPYGIAGVPPALIKNIVGNYRHEDFFIHVIIYSFMYCGYS